MVPANALNTENIPSGTLPPWLSAASDIRPGKMVKPYKLQHCYFNLIKNCLESVTDGLGHNGELAKQGMRMIFLNEKPYCDIEYLCEVNKHIKIQ